jgi:hypothetical protein
MLGAPQFDAIGSPHGDQCRIDLEGITGCQGPGLIDDKDDVPVEERADSVSSWSRARL